MDILKAGEWINITLGINKTDSPKPVKVYVRDPSGKLLNNAKPYDITKGSVGWLGTPGQALPSALTNPLQIQATKVGQYTITFDHLFESWLDPLDITVTSTKVKTITPGAKNQLGRLHATRWTMQGGKYPAAVNSAYYVLIPTGAGQNHTWMLEFNGLAGEIYDIIANSKGIPAPYSHTSQKKKGVTPPTGQFQLYLNPPAKGLGNTKAPVLTGFDFSGCTKHGANALAGQQSQFSFTSNVAATYEIILDTDKDGVFNKTKDTSFSGTAVKGLNTITWNGRDANNKVVAAGTYDAYVSLRLGEVHFVADDFEAMNPGLRIFSVNPPFNLPTYTGVSMFWNDIEVNKPTTTTPPTPKIKVIPETSLPTGINSGSKATKVVCSNASNPSLLVNAHCWGDFTSGAIKSPGETSYIDTWTFAKESTAKLKVTVLTATADDDKDGLTNQEECKTYKTDPGNKDTDGDGLLDGEEVKTYKTKPLIKDTDGDGLTDGEEVKTYKTKPLVADTDNDGLKDGEEVKTYKTSPLAWDTDKGGESDGSEVKNKRDPLKPGDDFGGPDAGVPDMKIVTPDQKVVTPDQKIVTPDQKVVTPDQKVVTPDQKVTQKDQKVTQKDQKVTQKDQKVTQKDQTVTQKDQTVTQKDQGQPGADGSTTPGSGMFFFGGGGCSVGGEDDGLGGLFLLLPVALLLAVRRRRRWLRRGSVAGLVLAGLLLASPAARAQGSGTTATPQVTFNSLVFQPAAATTINFFQTEGALLLPHLTPSAGLYFNYVHKPLQIWNDNTGETAIDVIKHQVTMDLMVAFGLWERLEIGVGLPVAFYQDSDNLSFLGQTSSLGMGLGDLRFVLKGRLFTVGPFSMAIALPLTVPTGKDEYFLGDDGVTFTPKAVLSVDTKWVDVGLNAGYRLRPDQTVELPTVANKVIIDDELVFSLGVKVAVWQEKIDFIADAWMSMRYEEMDKEEIPAEVVGGFRFYLPKGFTAHVGGGPGLTRGVVSPMFRVFAGVGYAYEPPPPPPPVVDTDPDKDGIHDPKDKCPNEPEDKDKFEDEDGCPDHDNDGDGILDKDDKCPHKAEDKDKFEDEDGCPDLDNDKDGVLDSVDKCPLQPEDKDKFEDEDGCPDPDNDKDGILDKDDKCPTEPESFNGYQDEDGCMDSKPKAKVQITRTAITVPPVYFATNKDKILKRSHSTLLEVVDLLKKNTWVKKIQVEGHTDDRGNDAFNMDLSERRAGSVKQFLLENGIKEGRLSAKGFGETKPITSNKTRKGRAQNRRVDFIILDPAQKKKVPVSAPAPEAKK